MNSEILKKLYDSEINWKILTFWDGGVDVWLGDGLNGFKAQTCFEASEMDGIPQWLHEQALKFYPDSEYAKNTMA
jgi:hypothetical protein